MAYEFTVKQGETRTLVVVVKSPTGVPVNLTAASCWLGIKKSASDDVYLIIKDSEFFDYGNATVGKVSVDLESNETLLEPGVYWLEIEVAFDDGRIQKTVADYFLKIKPAIIQPFIVGVEGGIAATSVMSEIEEE